MKKSNSLFIDDILYMENPKDSTPKLLELIQHFNNAGGYKIFVQKSVVFLSFNNKNTERENQFHLLQLQNHKIPGNKPNQSDKQSIFRELQNTHEINGRKP